MRLAELQYELPPELIAQRPAEPRDAARLLALHRSSGRIEHRVFRDIGEYLQPGDCLVLNNTRVIPARFFCRRQTGGKVEALFVRVDGDCWRVLLKPSARLKAGEHLTCQNAATRFALMAYHGRGEWAVRPAPPVPAVEFLERCGQTPLPPYIRSTTGGRQGAPDAADRERYQTVYASQPGAVAAPTAGLHFTPELLDELTRRGVRRTEVTLHVGPGTFTPIEVDDLSQHRMHAEWFQVSATALRIMREARAQGGAIVAIGTTSVRVLESLDHLDGGDIAGWTDKFIYPSYCFRHVDRLLTNFHLPGSTLLALVMAFGGVETVRAAYREAVSSRYRFYSYGDTMLVV